MAAQMVQEETRTPLKRKRSDDTGSNTYAPAGRSRRHRLSSLYGAESPHFTSFSSLLSSSELESESGPEPEPEATGDDGHDGDGGRIVPRIKPAFLERRACVRCLRWQGEELLAGRKVVACEEADTHPGSCTRCVQLKKDCVGVSDDHVSRSVERRLQTAHDALKAGKFDVRKHGCISKLWKTLNAHIHTSLQRTVLKKVQDSIARKRRDREREERERGESERQAQESEERGYEEEEQQEYSRQEEEITPLSPVFQRAEKPEDNPQDSERHDSVTGAVGMGELLTEVRLMREEKSATNRQVVAELQLTRAVISELLKQLRQKSS